MPARGTIRWPAAIGVLVVAMWASACGGTGTPSTGPVPPVDAPPDGAELFAAGCASCHGSRGEGGWSGVALDTGAAFDRQLLVDAIRYGVGAMPGSSADLSDDQVSVLVEYVAGLRR